MSPTKGRKPGIPDTLIIQRIKYAVELKQMGMSEANVLKKLNSMSNSRSWGEISSRQLKRDFAKHYQATRVVGFEEKDHNRAMRGIFLQEMEALVEMESNRIRLKKDWEPFEYEKSMKLLFDMKMKYADLMNWNESKQKEYTLKFNSLRPTNLEKFERASEEFKEMDKEVKDEFLVKPLEALAEKMKALKEDKTLDEETRAKRMKEEKNAVIDYFNPEKQENLF